MCLHVCIRLRVLVRFYLYSLFFADPSVMPKEVKMEKERQIAMARDEATKENKEESASQGIFRYLKDGPLQPLQQGSQSVTPMRERPGDRDTRVPWNKKNDVPPRPLKV
jgi:hypothetical protein